MIFLLAFMARNLKLCKKIFQDHIGMQGLISKNVGAGMFQFNNLCIFQMKTLKNKNYDK